MGKFVTYIIYCYVHGLSRMISNKVTMNVFIKTE